MSGVVPRRASLPVTGVLVDHDHQGGEEVLGGQVPVGLHIREPVARRAPTRSPTVARNSFMARSAAWVAARMAAGSPTGAANINRYRCG
ncbi:hypothetical protein GCM10009678_53100 [Actinomadura kijaniata]